MAERPVRPVLLSFSGEKDFNDSNGSAGFACLEARSMRSSFQGERQILDCA
jgi:hypothetical protein